MMSHRHHPGIQYEIPRTFFHIAVFLVKTSILLLFPKWGEEDVEKQKIICLFGTLVAG